MTRFARPRWRNCRTTCFASFSPPTSRSTCASSKPAGNRRILKAVQDMRAISRIIGMSRVRRDAEIVERASTHHDQIFDALAAGDPEAARRHMAEHIRSGKQSAVVRLEQDVLCRTSVTEIAPDLIEDLNQIDQSGRIDDEASPTPHAPKMPSRTVEMPVRDVDTTAAKRLSGVALIIAYLELPELKQTIFLRTNSKRVAPATKSINGYPAPAARHGHVEF